jgi:hypothetical protein
MSNGKLLCLPICMTRHPNYKIDVNEIWYWTKREVFYTKVMKQLLCRSITIKYDI